MCGMKSTRHRPQASQSKPTPSSDTSHDAALVADSLASPMGSRLQRIAVAARTLGIPEATIRDLRFHSLDRPGPGNQVIFGNGFAAVFINIGRAVFVDIVRFEEIIRSQENGGRRAS